MEGAWVCVCVFSGTTEFLARPNFDIESGRIHIQHPPTPGIPENTVAAFKHALACGADVLEFDVWLTADGQVAVFHDATLARMCGDGHASSSKGVADLAYADLPPIRVDKKGEHWGVTAANRREAQRIPLLSEVLAVVPVEQPMIIEFKQKDEVSC